MSNKLSLRDFYEELQKGRELELKNLWQRSVMLMTFFVIFFTAYAVLTGKAIEAISKDEGTLSLFNIPLLAVAICGLIVYVFWIQMSKGSKLWYEKYESSIDYYINSDCMYDKEVILKDHVSNLGKAKDVYPSYYPRHGHLCDNCDKTNDSLFSSCAGEYSVSRINTGIGLFGFIVWSSLILFHGILVFFKDEVTEAVIIAAIYFVVSISLFFLSGYTYSGNNKRLVKMKIRQRLKIFNSIASNDKNRLKKLLNKYYLFNKNVGSIKDSGSLPDEQFDFETLNSVNEDYKETIEKYLCTRSGSISSMLKIHCKRFIYSDWKEYDESHSLSGMYKLTCRIRDYEKLRHIDTLTWHYVKDIFKKLFPDIGSDCFYERRRSYSAVFVILLVIILTALIASGIINFVDFEVSDSLVN